MQIIERIRSEIRIGMSIPKPISDRNYQVIGWGKSRGEDALIYSIPSRSHDRKQSTKRLRLYDLKLAYEVLLNTGEFSRQWFNKNLPDCARDGGCNFTSIGGIFEMLGEAEYADRGIYRDKATIRAINQFLANLKDQLEKINQLSNNFFQKILYTVFIDTLSRAAFPNERKHRKRFIKFIDECSNWDDKDRVSSQQLLLILTEEGLSSGSLARALKDRVFSWVRGHTITPDQDPQYSEIQSLANDVELKHLNKARYKELFYTYRNNLLHEFKEPGKALSIWDMSSPYYHSFKGEPWQLDFPASFFRELCNSCLKGLEHYLYKNHINPYSSYDFGSLWRAS